MPKKPFERVQVTFHGKATGQRHGPIILSKSTPEQAEQLVQRAKKVSPNFPSIEARIVRTSGSKTFGFSHISDANWNRIFRKKKGGK